MPERIATNILVAARGHVLGDDSFKLGTSSMQRVDRLIGHYQQHESAFLDARKNGSGGIIAISGGYPTMAVGRKIAPPPYNLREGPMMARLAVEAGIPQTYIRTTASPTTTLEVVLRPYEEGFFTGLAISPDNPLGIVTQAAQYDRLEWFARRIYRLPRGAVQLIEAPGEENPRVVRDERRIMHTTRILYGMARRPYALRRAERIADNVSRILFTIGVISPPGQNYLDT